MPRGLPRGSLLKEYVLADIEEFFDDMRYFDRDKIKVQNVWEEDRIIKDIK